VPKTRFFIKKCCAL